MDLNFHPQRIETVTLDGIQHADKGLVAWKTLVRHVNEVDRSIMRDQRLR